MIPAKGREGKEEGPRMKNPTRQFTGLATFLILAGWATSLGIAAFVFVQGPIEGHGAIVPAFFLMVLGMASLVLAFLLAAMAAKAGGDRSPLGFRVAQALSGLGAIVWILWFAWALR